MEQGNLRDIREANRKTCVEVAQALNVTQSAVRNYEQGIRTINIEQVLILAELYNCTEKEIIMAQLTSQRVKNRNAR